MGPYRIEERLGSGGMGSVYRAWDERLERHVAIKHLHRHHAADPRVLSRLRREAKALANLGHPAVVQVYDVVETPAGEWVVMELVRGETLRTLIKCDGPLPWPRAAAVARDICSGLAAAHEQGVVHRDLKSENVMVTAGWRVKILDFGLAKRLAPEIDESRLTQHGEILGTVRSMSPEQARGEEVDPRSDLFSLGTLLYEMLTGEPPFRGRSLVQTLSMICHHAHLPVRELRTEVPAELCELLDRLLEKMPDRRPPSAAEIEHQLEAFAEPRDPSATRSMADLAAGPLAKEPVSSKAWAKNADPTSADRPLSGLSSASPVYQGKSTDSRGESTDDLPTRAGGSRSGLWPLRPGLFIVPLAVVVLVLAAVLLVEMRRDPTDPASVAGPVRLAVLGFENLSGDPAADWLAAALTESLVGELMAMGLDLAPGESVARMKAELALREVDTLAPDTAARAGRLLGASHILVGSYLVLADPEGDRLRVQMEVQRTLNGDVVGAARQMGSAQDLGDLAARVGNELRGAFGDG